MKIGTLLIIIALSCHWTNIEPEELKITPIFGVLKNIEKPNFEAACEVSIRLKVTFEKVSYCKRKKILKIRGYVTDEEGAPFSRCNIISANVGDVSLIPKSENFQSDEAGFFDLALTHEKDDGICFFAVNSTIITVEIN